MLDMLTTLDDDEKDDDDEAHDVEVIQDEGETQL